MLDVVLKPSSFLPTAAGLTAFILSLISLFAGTQYGFETGCEYLTLFTPDAGNASGIRGIYTIYAMSYCEGYVGSDGQGRNITRCFNRTLPFSFDPTEVLRRDNQSSMALLDVGWPDAITGDFRAFALTNRAMSVLYCIGVGVAGASVLVRLGLVIAGMRQQQMVEGLISLVSFISLGIASIIVTAVSSELIDLVNYHGKESGMTAQYGQKFMGMTWSATALLLVGSTLSLLPVVRDRSRPGTGPSAEPKEEVEAAETADATES